MKKIHELYLMVVISHGQYDNGFSSVSKNLLLCCFLLINKIPQLIINHLIFLVYYLFTIYLVNLM